jgi:transcriptional regulator with AAA-type ATPase domain
MTLRTFSAAVALIDLGGWNARDACEIAYIAQMPRNERETFRDHLDQLGTTSSMDLVREKLEKKAQKRNIYAHREFLAAAVPAYIAMTYGLHVLLEDPSGCGLSTLAQFISEVCACESRKRQKQAGNGSEDVLASSPRRSRPEICRVLLRQESTIENIISSFKPQ